MTSDNERFRFAPINTTFEPFSRERRWNEDPRRIALLEIMRDTSNPDLRDFRDTGGKLLMWHGLSDQSVLPWGAVDYYEMLMQAMGGEEKTQEFARFFLMPGVNHVYRGVGAHSVDWLAYMEAWVERGVAPDKAIGVQVKDPGNESDMIPMRPYTTEEIAFSRPHFPYPLRYRYSGKGDPNDAASFVAYRPKRSR
jgi:feruloyl esterase